MNESGSTRVPGLEVEWKDLSEEHRERREQTEQAIENWPADPVEATYVIGAIGAGKTQLLTHLFKYAYREAGKPALYVTMGRLLDGIEGRDDFNTADGLSQDRLHEAMEAVVRTELQRIHETIAENGSLVRDLYLIDSGRITVIDRYAETMGIDRDRFLELTAEPEDVIFIVDEMEESYARLGELVSQQTGPLREVVQRVESRNSLFYLIGGFGYASVNELGEAEYRRIQPVTLPIIRPQTIPDIIGKDIDADLRNFTWWMSRGRPGWLEIASTSFEEQQAQLEGTYDSLGDLVNPEMGRVDIIALEELEQYVSGLDRAGRDITAYSIYHPAPVPLEADDSPAVEQITGGDPPVLTDTVRTEVNAVADAFIDGSRNTDLYDSEVSDQAIRRYLVRILDAVADHDGHLVFGAVHRPLFDQGNVCRIQMLEPLAERVHDMALEEAGDEYENTVDFLYELSQHIQGTEVETLSTEFGEFFDLFSSDADLGASGVMGPGIKSLVITFPSLITNPRLNFAATGKSEREQLESVVNTLRSSDKAGETLQKFGTLLSGDRQ